MFRMILITALLGGWAGAPPADASLLSRHHEVWDDEWQEATNEWESQFGRLLGAIQTRDYQAAQELMAPMTGVLARINTLAQPAARRDLPSVSRAVASILVERSRETLLRYGFERRADLDLLSAYLTQLANRTTYDAFKDAGRARVRDQWWRAGGINSGLFGVGVATGSGSMAGLFVMMHTHLYTTATPISLGVGILAGGGLIKVLGKKLPRGPRRGDLNVVKPRLVDCRTMLEHF